MSAKQDNDILRIPVAINRFLSTRPKSVASELTYKRLLDVLGALLSSCSCLNLFDVVWTDWCIWSIFLCRLPSQSGGFQSESGS